MTTDIIPASASVPMLPSATDTERLARLASHVSSTDFVPRSLRGNPPAILACFLTARELGIHPMRGLRQINIIDGSPTPSPELMMALALRAGHVVRVTETTHEQCTVMVRRADWDRDDTVSLTWHIDDAVRAGLCTIDPDTGRPRARSRSGNPLPWETYTRAMLRSRAVSEACRTWLPDVVEGFSYTPEELGGAVDGDGHAVEVIETAAAHGVEYDPMEGVPQDIRDAVEAQMDPDDTDGSDDDDGVQVIDVQAQAVSAVDGPADDDEDPDDGAAVRSALQGPCGCPVGTEGEILHVPGCDRYVAPDDRPLVPLADVYDDLRAVEVASLVHDGGLVGPTWRVEAWPAHVWEAEMARTGPFRKTVKGALDAVGYRHPDTPDGGGDDGDAPQGDETAAQDPPTDDTTGDAAAATGDPGATTDYLSDDDRRGIARAYNEHYRAVYETDVDAAGRMHAARVETLGTDDVRAFLTAPAAAVRSVDAMAQATHAEVCVPF